MNKLILILALFMHFFQATASADNKSFNNYANLPLPDANQIESLARSARLPQPEIDKLSGDQRDRFFKLLGLAKWIGVAALPNWQGGATASILSPFQYLLDLSNATAFDLTQATTIAYNSNRDIFFGARFLTDPPLESISTLVHEAHHSEPKAANHVSCRQGDIPLSRDGCDETLKIDDATSGAYAYEISFDIGLPENQPNLPASDRLFLESAAVMRAGTRINTLPSDLATPHDLVAVLDRQGKVFFLHPFNHTLIDSGIHIPGEIIIRIEFNWRTNALNLYTQSKKIYSWDFDGSLTENAPTIFKDPGIHVIDVSVMYNGETPLTYYLNDQNQLFYVHFDTKTDEKIVTLSQFQPSGFQAVKTLMGPEKNRYMLGSTGKLYAFDDDHNNLHPSILQAPGGDGWVFVTSGRFSDTLYLIAHDGHLFFSDGQADAQNNYFAKESDFQVDAGMKAIKYVEGTNIRALLDQQGTLYFKPYTNTKVTSFPNLSPSIHNIVDFTMVRPHELHGPLSIQKSIASKKFISHCGISSTTFKPAVDPWLHRGFGINNNGAITFEGDTAHPCLHLKNSIHQISNLKIIDQEADPKSSYPKSALQVFEPAKTTILNPYLED